MSKKNIHYNNITYESIRKLYNELAPPFSYTTFASKLAKYGSVEKALASPRPQPNEVAICMDEKIEGHIEMFEYENTLHNGRWRHQKGVGVSLWGNTYQSIAVVCQLFGVSPGVVYDYMAREKTQDLAIAIQYAMELGIDVENVRYPSIGAAAVAYKQDYMLVLTRIHKGWTLIDALTKPPMRKYNGKPITVFGMAYSSIREACSCERISICRLPKRNIPIDRYLEILIRVRELYIKDDSYLPARVPYLVVDEDVFRTRNDVVGNLLTVSEAHLKRKNSYGFNNIPDMMRYLSASGFTKKDAIYVYAPLEYRRYLIQQYDTGTTQITSIPLPTNLLPYVEWFRERNPGVELHFDAL